MSYKAQIKVYNDPKFYDNAIRLATSEEADAYGRNKRAAWTMADDYRVAESDEPVNYRWDVTEGLVSIEVSA